MLQEHVFPRLQALAQENGCRFQAIDLRWGVSSEAALDQQTMKICLGEISRCQTISPKPNFIILMGDRYGWRPLPYEILENEFQQILRHIPETKIRDKVSHQWYLSDTNAVPPTRVLQPRMEDYVDDAIWSMEETQLQTALATAAERAGLMEEELIKYMASATEQEINQGLFNVPDPHEHIFCFSREIQDLPWDDSVKGFLDLTDGVPDQIALDSAKKLKQCLADQLGENFFVYKTAWLGSSPELNFIDRFCEDVYGCLSRVILNEINQLAQVDLLEQDIQTHLDFGRDHTRHFIGRKQIIDQIWNYLRSSSEHPLVIVAPSGMGKSALAAKIRIEVEESQHWAVIARFIGASPDSTSIRALLLSLSRQIAKITDADKPAFPEDLDSLVSEFPKWLKIAGEVKPLLLIIDAVDQLADERKNKALSWIPGNLPANVKCIITTTPGKSQEILRQILPDHQFYPLDRMTITEGEDLLSLWLESAHRQLTPDQYEEIIEKFSNTGLPLFLRLAFDEAKQWHSYDGLPEYEAKRVGLGEDIPQLFNDFLWRLSRENNHGAVIVERSLGYLASAKNGLSEGELYDILCEDEIVIEDFLQRSPNSPVVDRLPIVVFSRLLFDLQPYLSENSADQTLLLRFNHPLWVDLIQKKYLGDGKQLKVHRTLAAFFEKRDVSVRKVEELPFHLVKIGSWEKLAEILTDWLYFEFAWGHDHTAVERQWAEIEENSNLRMVEMYQDIIEKYPNNLIYIGHVVELMIYTYRHQEVMPLQAYLLEQQRKEVNPVDLVERLNVKGISLKNTGDLDGAMAAYLEAEEISRNLGDKRLLATVLGNQGNVFRRKGQLIQAQKVLDEGVGLARQIKDFHVLFSCLNALGLLYYEMEEYEESLEIFVELEEDVRAYGDPLMLASVLGNKCALMGELWEGTPEQLAAIRSEEIEIYRELGIPKKFLDALRQKQKIVRRQIRQITSQPINNLDERSKQKLATCYLEEEAICKDLGDFEGMTLAQSERAVVMAAMGRPEAAELIAEALKRAVGENMEKVVEEVRENFHQVNEMMKG